MGKATIMGGGPNGSYTIKINYGTAKRTARIVVIDRLLAELAPAIATGETKVAEQQALVDAALVAANIAINEYVTATQAVPPAFQAVTSAREQVELLARSPIATEEERTAAQVALTAAETAYTLALEQVKVKLAAQVKTAIALVEEKGRTAPLQLALDLLNDEKKKLNDEKSTLLGLTLEETKQAWCADLTTNATGVVGTLEIPGESSIVLIKPAAPAASGSDGELVAREIQSPEQVFWNAAVLPGWQKFKPTYRRGTITALNKDANTASVSLTDDKSSANRLGINRFATLSNIPVEYMICHASAFEVGDACVIRFTGGDWATAKVVGFVTNPKPCVPKYVYVALQKTDVLGSITGDRWITTLHQLPHAEAGYIDTYGTYVLRIRSHFVATGAKSTSPTTLTGYTINVTPTALHTYVTDYVKASHWAPPGAVGTAYGIDIDEFGVSISEVTESVPDETHRFYIERDSGPDRVGGVFQNDETTTWLTNGGVEGSMPGHEYVRDVLGIVPVVTLVHGSDTYSYTLESSIGSTLVYVFAGKV